jgi:transposase-like protein
MKEFPETALEFQDWFRSEEACRDYIIHMRWPDGFRCPKCSGAKAWFTEHHRFHCASCGRQTSVIVGTIFQDTRQPLRLWFQAMWYVVNQKQGVSALGLQKALGLGSYRTAWTWLHKLRRAMIRPGRERLAGIVEVDETLIGGYAPGKPGRSHGAKVLVLVGVEDRGKEGFGRIRLKVIPDASGPTLERAVGAMVELGSIVRTDGWKGYNGLSAKGFHHDVVDRTEEEPGTDPTPLVHRIASLSKRWLMGTHHGRVESTHLGYYLDEFTFRFNRRKSWSRGKLFYRLMQQAVEIAPVMNRDLKGHNP